MATVWRNPYSNVLSSNTDGASFEIMQNEERLHEVLFRVRVRQYKPA